MQGLRRRDGHRPRAGLRREPFPGRRRRPAPEHAGEPRVSRLFPAARRARPAWTCSGRCASSAPRKRTSCSWATGRFPGVEGPFRLSAEKIVPGAGAGFPQPLHLLPSLPGLRRQPLQPAGPLLPHPGPDHRRFPGHDHRRSRRLHPQPGPEALPQPGSPPTFPGDRRQAAVSDPAAGCTTSS